MNDPWTPKQRAIWALRKKTLSPLLLTVCFLLSSINSSAELNSQLLDQTVAVVAKSVLTQRDVLNDHRISYSIHRNRVPKSADLRLDREGFMIARDQTVENALILNYLESIGLIEESAVMATSDERKAITKTLGGEKALETYLRDSSISIDSFNQVLKRLHAREVFFKQHLPFRVTISDEKVKAFYEEGKENKFLGKPFEKVESLARLRLKKELIQEEYRQWLSDEKKRVRVILLPLPEEQETFAPSRLPR